MRPKQRVVAAALAVSMSVPAFAQEWTEFVSREDRFTTNFPGQPRVTETIYKSQFGADLPARVYSASLGDSRYSMTVVDYGNIEKLLTEKARSCPPGAETCRGGTNPGSSTGAGYWKVDYAGALVYASWNFMQREGKVTEFIWTNIDLVEGYLLHLTNPTNREPTRRSSCTATGSTSARRPCLPAHRSLDSSNRRSDGSTRTVRPSGIRRSTTTASLFLPAPADSNARSLGSL